MAWLPYGLTLTNFWPDCQGDNAGYNNAAQNTYNFWGWDKYFNLYATFLYGSLGAGLEIEEWDIINEIALTDFVVQGRLIVDTYHNTDVFGYLRWAMEQVYGPGTKGRVTYSTAGSNPMVTNQTPPWSVETFDCGSVYGDTAMIMDESEITAAVNAGLVGMPSGLTGQPLKCGGSTAGMAQSPFNYDATTVTINDIHHHTCIIVPGSNPERCYDPQTDQLALDYGAVTSRNFYNGIWNFFTYRGFTTHKAMLGETNHTTPSLCDGYDISMAFSNVNGFNGYGGSSSMLFQNAASNTVLRVWENVQAPCYVLPTALAPPYSP